ncbi:pyruvate decarboxylase 2-like [Olea europaea subsp. europaea]|uniref:Pyruvate decarboxylase 2-like n=1 Tax=Olea europaea subsp. europaea TaxID=158383 RepID=A0A8S0T175_OLEEU|nr:pyruvate decarboxylase 2-like [Olea europaea subsp. europaea]
MPIYLLDQSLNDYNSVGYSLSLKKEKAIVVQPDHVVISHGLTYGCVLMKDFLRELAKKLKCNSTANENYKCIYIPDGIPLESEFNEPLRVNVLFQHIQKMLSSEIAIIAKTRFLVQLPEAQITRSAMEKATAGPQGFIYLTNTRLKNLNPWP